MKIRYMTLAMVALTATSSAQAALLNPGFESSLLTPGWAANPSGGVAQVVTSHAGDASTTYTPQEGNYFLALQAGDGDIWQTVTQTLSMNAGDKLDGWAAFDWRDVNDPVDGFYPDGARVRILDSTGAVMATPFFDDGNGDADYFDGPWTQWSFLASQTDSYTIEFGALNTADALNSSYGLFDVTLTEFQTPPPGVPEPASLALLSLGLIGLGLARRRKN